jgi:single-stranded-DNA-specific exonuclease
LLLRYGGHSQAAGFTVRTSDIGTVTERLAAYASERLSDLDLAPAVEIDAVTSLPELTMDVFEWLSSLEPFGKGNRRPLFASLGVTLIEARYVGHSQRHLRLRVEQSGVEMVALAFNQTADWTSLGAPAAGTRLDLAYTLMLDSWQGQESLALRVSRFRISEPR